MVILISRLHCIEHTFSIIGLDDLLVENNEAPLETVTDLSEARKCTQFFYFLLGVIDFSIWLNRG